MVLSRAPRTLGTRSGGHCCVPGFLLLGCRCPSSPVTLFQASSQGGGPQQTRRPPARAPWLQEGSVTSEGLWAGTRPQGHCG